MLPQSVLTFICLISTSIFALTLTACAPFTPNSVKSGVCNELNSRIIFSGNTSNIQSAEMQQAQQGLVRHNYDKSCGG